MARAERHTAPRHASRCGERHIAERTERLSSHAASLSDERIPDEFDLDQLSMYQLDEDPAGQAPVICKLLHRSQLGTSAPPGMKRRTTLLP